MAHRDINQLCDDYYSGKKINTTSCIKCQLLIMLLTLKIWKFYQQTKTGFFVLSVVQCWVPTSIFMLQCMYKTDLFYAKLWVRFITSSHWKRLNGLYTSMEKQFILFDSPVQRTARCPVRWGHMIKRTAELPIWWRYPRILWALHEVSVNLTTVITWWHVIIQHDHNSAVASAGLSSQ